MSKRLDFFGDDLIQEDFMKNIKTIKNYVIIILTIKSLILTIKSLIATLNKSV